MKISRYHSLLTLTVLVGLVCWVSAASGQEPPANPKASGGSGVLRTLRPGHPRLYVLDSELPEIKSLIQQDPQVNTWYQQLEQRAEKMLTEPPVEHKLVGPRLLDQSRAALERIGTLCFLYRLDGDRRKAERARREMLTAANFPDWNPSHFLDVAEMTHGMALGYDWLYSFLSPEDRAAVREAIVGKGLKEGLRAYENRAWWTETPINWNQVCNGGLTLGALAVADEVPEVAGRMIDLSRQSMVIAMHTFAPDGGWIEGPGYWSYTTEYTSYYIAAVESALGTDFGLTKMLGFADTGMFRIHSTGPLGLTFNFSDADPDADIAPQMFWLAQTFHQPLYAEHERQMVAGHPDIFHLIWSRGSVARGSLSGIPTDAVFRAIDTAFFRSRWSDPEAAFVGFKGGDDAANHSHLDLGTFVFDEFGQRWALDLGPDDYNLPEYFGKLRWTYYRLRTEGHNTLVVNGQNQNPKAQAPLLAFRSAPEKSYAVADMTAGYAPALRHALRGIALLNRRAVLIQDEVEAGDPADIVWKMHTKATIDLRGSSALLTLGDKQLEARILSPVDTRFEVTPADPPPPQAQQPDVRCLIIRLSKFQGRGTLAVLLTPAKTKDQVKIGPLSNWIAEGSLKP